LNGGFSTFLALVLLASSKSHVFSSFFKVLRVIYTCDNNCDCNRKSHYRLLSTLPYLWLIELHNRVLKPNIWSSKELFSVLRLEEEEEEESFKSFLNCPII
jgi:hypothetical protein